MNQKMIIQEAEKFMRENIPESRVVVDYENSYLKHVLGVKKYGLKLAKKYNADVFVIEVAALLHDVGANAIEKHAEESAKIAEKFLSKFNLSLDYKSRILLCIQRHSSGYITETIEEQIIQDADAIIFLEDTFKFFFAKRKLQLPLQEARDVSIKQVQKTMTKIKTEEGIRLAQNFYDNAIQWLKVAV